MRVSGSGVARKRRITQGVLLIQPTGEASRHWCQGSIGRKKESDPVTSSGSWRKKRKRNRGEKSKNGERDHSSNGKSNHLNSHDKSRGGIATPEPDGRGRDTRALYNLLICNARTDSTVLSSLRERGPFRE